MRLLHVYSGNLYGGVEAMLLTMARTASNFPDTRAEFALCFDGQLAAELRAAGATVHPLPPVRTSRPWTVWASRRALRRVLREGRFDVVVCHSPWPHAVFGPVARRAGRLVFWTHQFLHGRSFDERWAKWCRPEFAVCNSAFTAGSVGILFPGLRTEVVYCPHRLAACADPDAARREVRAELGTADGTRVILQACRLQELKGHRLHLRALGLLRDLPGWECWLAGGVQRAGEEAYLTELKQLAADQGIADRTRFLGHRRDVPRLLAAADVVCQPNEAPDSFGLAFVEGLAAGRPVVTTRMGGAVEIIDPTCGVLTDPTPEAVAAALRELLTGPPRTSTNGPARAVELCDPVRNMTRLYDLLRKSA
jgi:glycosyltransferase involved in cell wall biosynthesis